MDVCEPKLEIMIVDSDKPVRLGEELLVFLDLDKFSGTSLEEKTKRIKGWVATQRSQPSYWHSFMPCVIAISAHELDSEKAEKALQRAGVIFQKKPDGYDSVDSEEAKKALLKKWFFNLWGTLEFVDIRPVSKERYAKDHRPKDLSAYLDPPYQLSDEDYERLIQRAQMSDDDWRKDD